MALFFERMESGKKKVRLGEEYRSKKTIREV
jgi:hypothetical protein